MCNSYKKLLLFLGLFSFMLIHLLMFRYQLSPEKNLFFYVFVYLQVVVVSMALVFPYFSTLKYTGLFFKPIQFLSVHSYAIYLVNYSKETIQKNEHPLRDLIISVSQLMANHGTNNKVINRIFNDCASGIRSNCCQLINVLSS